MSKKIKILHLDDSINDSEMILPIIANKELAFQSEGKKFKRFRMSSHLQEGRMK